MHYNPMASQSDRYFLTVYSSDGAGATGHLKQSARADHTPPAFMSVAEVERP